MTLWFRDGLLVLSVLSDRQLFQIPYINTEFGRRSFSCSLPKIWSEIRATVGPSAAVVTVKRGLTSCLLSQLATR